MRILGIDYGERRVGVAVSDQLCLTSQGLPTIIRISNEQLLEDLAGIIKEKEVEKIIVGLPKNMDNSIGKKAEEALEFARNLESHFKIPVISIDERLTTVRAYKVMSETKMSRKKKLKKVDMISAQLILQSYLDRNAQENI